ncbi:MAG: HD domain-containing protein [Dehalococcoidia bacterium]|nr:HD domain-containing protein [Dehalococcoidia bacterium]
MPSFFNEAIAALRVRGIPAHVVGGAVRDLLLGRKPADLDVTISGPSRPVAVELAAALNAHLVPMDEERGHYRLMQRTGSGWVDISSDNGDLEADLSRRDFSIGALAIPVERWPGDAHVHSSDPALLGVIDPCGGLRDLRQRIVRVVSEKNVQDDPVRLIRAVRIATQLKFRIDDATRLIIRRNATSLGRSAPERVRDEVYAIFSGPSTETGIRVLDALGLLDLVFPEIAETRGITQPNSHHYWDVFEHLVHTVGRAEAVLDRRLRIFDPFIRLVPWGPELDGYFDEVVADGQTRTTFLRMSALLHDIAKPRCSSFDQDGRIRFLGHQEMGEEMSRHALERLRCSRKAVWHISTMVRHHLRPSQMVPVESAGWPSKRAVYRFWRDLEGVATDTLFLSMADHLGARGPKLDLRDWTRVAGIAGAILAAGFVTPGASKPFLLLDGNEIMAEFGLTPGPEVGLLLNMLREAEATGQVQDHEQALVYLRHLAQETKHQ